MIRPTHASMTGLLLLVVAAPALAKDPSAKYTCDDGTQLVVQFHNVPSGPGSATLSFKDTGRKVTIPQVMSADGGRYADAKLEFWIKGKQATFTRGDQVTTCRTGD